MAQDNTLLYVIGGVGLLWLFARGSPGAIAQQQIALQSAADLQSQAISTNANVANVQTAANLINNLAADFTP